MEKIFANEGCVISGNDLRGGIALLDMTARASYPASYEIISTKTVS